MNVNIRTNECAWAQFEVKILGRKIKGLRGFEFKKAIEKEHLYGAGNEPIDIQEGNKSYTGNISVLGFEVDAMNRAARAAGFEDITEVPHEAIVITAKFQKLKTDPKTFITVTGVSFSEVPHAMKQNDKNREIQLPFLAMNMSSETI
ncbi:MAG: hypothetical protein LBD53_01100 [Tannerella sp.]|jgi:hypothetical protein|nr:hypothetical protein [Tannerella sp.]